MNGIFEMKVIMSYRVKDDYLLTGYWDEKTVNGACMISNDKILVKYTTSSCCSEGYFQTIDIKERDIVVTSKDIKIAYNPFMVIPEGIVKEFPYVVTQK